MPIDVALSADGALIYPPRAVTGIELVAQRIRRRLRTHLRDYFLDPSIGLDYLTWLQTRPPPLATISGRTRREVEQTPGVIRVESWSATYDREARRVSLSGVAITDEDGEVSISTTATEEAAALGAPWFLTVRSLT